MKSWGLLSPREKKIFISVALVIAVLLMDLMSRAWHGALSGLLAKEKAIKKEWIYSSTLIARGPAIDAHFSEIKFNNGRLFDDQKDTSKIMTELDGLAKAAGVQVNMIRPMMDANEDSARFEMTLKGSWSQMAKFFQAAEARESSFDFLDVSLHRQEISGELNATVIVQRMFIEENRKS